MSNVERLPLLALALAIGASCSDPVRATETASRADVTDGIRMGVSTAGARFVQTIAGFNDPESVRYDPEQDVFFVSNMNGLGSQKDTNGYIVRAQAADPRNMSLFVVGGPGVELHAPKGMAIQGDTLWVTDIDVVRGYDRRSGKPVGTIDFAAHRPVMLNDVAAGPDGTLRVTDTGILMVYEGNKHVGGDRVFAVEPGRRVRVVAQGPQLRLPNGIAWSARDSAWIVVSFDPFHGDVAALRGERDPRRLLHHAKGRLDGLAVLDDGRILFTSWADSTLHLLDG
ncbi:MAG TPA: SMP-30/gluconolactonase/LRE family protein, partial [Gemmatimonadaceae bacterium]|nr:SMP-30/gluconolactonase/LRE family protein [Gemmatimonadaceae bacterium]